MAVSSRFSGRERSTGPDGIGNVGRTPSIRQARPSPQHPVQGSSGGPRLRGRAVLPAPYIRAACKCLPYLPRFRSRKGSEVYKDVFSINRGIRQDRSALGLALADRHGHYPHRTTTKSAGEVDPGALGIYLVSVVYGEPSLILWRRRECLRSNAVVAYPIGIDLAKEQRVAIHFVVIANWCNSVFNHSHASPLSRSRIRSVERLVRRLRQCHSAA